MKHPHFFLLPSSFFLAALSSHAALSDLAADARAALTNVASKAETAASGVASNAAVVAETLLADGSTNTWTEADLVAALQLLNRKYRRDIETESGRRAWHGKSTTQTLLTNDLGQIFMRRAYEDGFTWDDKAKAPTPAAVASNIAARVRLSLPTNGVSPGIAALRTASAATPFATTLNATTTINGNVKRSQRYVRQYDAYGNVTNQVFAGWSELERGADGSFVFRTYDTENNLVREVVRKGRTDTVTFPETNAAPATATAE